MKITEYDNAKMKEMNDKDKRMLESALWHISNSVTNGKSQTAECEITQWLKEKFNVSLDEQPSEEVNKEIDRFIEENVGKTITVGQVAHYFAKWQKEQIIKSAINGCYIKRNKYTKQNVLNGLSVTCEAIQKFKDGDKVKIIIIKEDEQ